MIALDCRKVWPGPHGVRVRGSVVGDVFAVYALWNGGPGVIGYYPRTVRGHLYTAAGGKEAAIAWRLCWSVRVDRLQETDA